MIKTFLPQSYTTTEFAEAMQSISTNDSISSILLLATPSENLTKDNIDPILTDCSVDIMGGVFPEIIHENKSHPAGVLMVGFNHSIENVIIEDFSNSDHISDLVESTLGDIDPKDKTFFIFADALLDKKNMVFESLYDEFGTLPKYIGGGAGSLEFNSFPCLFTNNGMLEGAMTISLMDITTSVGVAHGWESITPPLKVTEAQGNQIISLNWKPAMEVYEEIIVNHSGKSFDYENFFDTTKSYPFGISKLNSEMIVRDPFMTEDGKIFTLDTIPQGSHVSVLYGNKSSLLKGASQAKERALENVKSDVNNLFIIDCISRVLYMGEDFKEEIGILDSQNIGFGALTLGEIANNGDSFLDVYNKTAVVCAIHDNQ